MPKDPNRMYSDGLYDRCSRCGVQRPMDKLKNAKKGLCCIDTKWCRGQMQIDTGKAALAAAKEFEKLLKNNRSISAAKAKKAVAGLKKAASKYAKMKKVKFAK